jgi:MFS family permease
LSAAAEDRRGYTYAILVLINVLNIYDRQVLGAVLEPLRHEFHLSDAQLGALPTVFTLVYAVAGVPLGRLADRGSRKRLLAMGVAGWAALTAAGGLAASYLLLLISRVGVGIGEAVCSPAATSWIADLFPAKRRARAMAGFMMAVPVGVMLSFALSGAIAQAYGWRAAMAAAAAPALLLVPALFRLREPERAPISRSGRAGALLGIPALWWIGASGAIANFILYSFSTFISPFLTRYHGLSVAEAGLWSGVGSGAAGVAGALIAGWCGDRVVGSGRLRLAAAAALVSIVPAAAGLATNAAVPAVILLMLAYGALQMYYGLVYAAIQDLAPADLRATAMALYLMVTYLCGGAAGPLATGRLSDYFARQAAGGGAVTEAARAAGLHHAMYVVPVFAAVLAVVLWIAGRSGRGVGNQSSIPI